MSSLVVHHLNNSRSQRVLWLLEELQVPYTIKHYTRLPSQQAPPELLDINPLGKSPTITDGDVTLSESGAIVEYIISKYGGDNSRVPESGKLDNLYFTHYAEGSLMPLVAMKYIFLLIPQQAPFLIRPLFWYIFGAIIRILITPQLKRHCNLIESHLSRLPQDAPFFASSPHPTSADYMMVFPLEALASRDDTPFIGEKARQWVRMVQERPAYKKALEKGGDYAYAKL